MHLKLLLFAYLFVALILGFNVASALRTETPTLGELFQPTAVTRGLNTRGITSADPALMREIMGWQFEIGFTSDWYTSEPPIVLQPEGGFRFETDGTREGRVYMIIFGDRVDPNIVYPAIFSYTRIFGDHEDKDLHNHPDLGWWSMERANVDALLEALEG